MRLAAQVKNLVAGRLRNFLGLTPYNTVRGRLRREQQRDSSGGGIGIMRRSFFAVSLFGLLQDGFSHLNKGAC